jgi:hypothetical protein
MNARRLFLLAPIALFLAIGCRQQTGLNIPCQLVKRDPADGGILTIKEKEIKVGAGKDFISFGSAECEDFVCVRDSNFTRADAGDQVPDPEAPALGYCSRSCLPNTECPSQEAGDDESAARRLSCRPLLLDAETISQICTVTPGVPFCGASTPYFCARGSNDAGI